MDRKSHAKPIAEITMESDATMRFELYPALAPKTTENFMALADGKFYDGLIFHRVISGFMIQGGDPTGTGTGGSEDPIFGEFEANGFRNPVSHSRGTISMARSRSFNSASSQFFVCHADSFFLDGQYAGFGKLISGADALDAIAACATDRSDRPLKEQKIRAIRVLRG